MKASASFAGLLSIGAVSALIARETKGTFADCLGQYNVPVEWTNSPAYPELVEPFNLRLPYKPVAISLPTKPKHVQDAVKCAAQHRIKVQAKSGGHSYASFSSGGKDGSLVIFLQGFQDVVLNPQTNVAVVGGGVRLGNLAKGIWDQGKRALPHGTCPGVGIGGHFTHGGYGHTSRHWGIALDTIVGLDVVLADGRRIYACKDQYPEIFWALRGAADSIGIIVNFHLKTEAAPKEIVFWSFQWPTGFYDTKENFVDSWLHIQEFSKNESVVDSRISFGNYLDGTVFNIGGAFFGTEAEFNKTIAPEFLRTLREPKTKTVKAYEWIPYLTLVSDKKSIEIPKAGYDDHDNFFAKSITVPQSDGWSKASLEAWYEYMKKGAPTDYFVITNLYGGPGSKINSKDKNTDFAAYSERDSLFVSQLYGYGPDGNKSVEWINNLHKTITGAAPQTKFGAYLNYVDPSLDAKTAHELYYGQDLYKRILKVKNEVDPGRVFWNPQAIGN